MHRTVEFLLSQAYGVSVRLARGRYIRRPSVCRFPVRSGPPEVGSSVIVKRLRHRDRSAMQATSYPAARWMFFNDWAGLQFIERPVERPAIAPRLYAADAAAGMLVLEDLRPQADAGTYLMGASAATAEHALLQWAATLGRLHASTIGKRETFDALRDALAPRHSSWGWVPPWQRAPATFAHLMATLPPDTRRQPFERFDWMPAVLRRAAASLDLPFAPAAEADLACVGRALRDPAAFLAYTHGDPCPENCLFTPDGLKLVDFENGAYRHALLDAAYPRMGFPTCWNARPLPDPIVASAERAYRTALGEGCPDATNDRRFAQELVHACAYWALLMCQFDTLPHLARRDRHWGPTTMRQRAILRFERFAATTAEYAYLEALGDQVRRMAGVLRQRWPRAAQHPPPYPAFHATRDA